MNKIIALIKHYTGYGKDVDEACQWIDELVKERDDLRAALARQEAQSAPSAVPKKSADEILAIITEHQEASKSNDGDWHKGYRAALHWISKAINGIEGPQ